MQLNAVNHKFNAVKLSDGIMSACKHRLFSCFVRISGGCNEWLFFGSCFFSIKQLFLYSQNAARSSVLLKVIHMPIHVFKHS